MPEAAPSEVAFLWIRRSTSEPAEDGGHGRQRGGGEGAAGLGVEAGVEGRALLAGEDDRADVEAVPAHPEQTRAEHGEREVVRAHLLAGPADALAEEHHEHERRDAGVDVHRGAAGVVLRADPAADERVLGAAEDHVRHREVDEQRPERDEDHPGGELQPVGDRAADQRCGDDREGHLEHHADVGVGGDAVEPEQLERVGEERAVAAEAHRPADGDVEDADDRCRDVGHHHHVEHGLRPGHAAVEQGQGGHRHHQDEGSRHQHEGVVAVHRTSRVRAWLTRWGCGPPEA